MSGGMDRQTLFHWILPATTGGLTNATPVDCHLNIKDKKCDVGLSKNYCITISIQKIGSIYKLIQLILGSHELMTLPIQKSLKLLPAFLNLHQHAKN